MTNRRSIAANNARASRAFQFVPGHMSGRVASAQPVIHRNTVGVEKNGSVAGQGPIPLAFPSAIVARTDNQWPGGAVYGRDVVPAVNAGSSYFVLAVSDGVVGTCVAPTCPTGWATLLSGTSGSDKWGLFALNKAGGTEGKSVDFGGSSAYGWWSLELVLDPSDPSGTWSASMGSTYTGSPGLSTYATIDPAARVWAQVGFDDRHYGGGHLPASTDYCGYGKQGIDYPISGSVVLGTIGGWGAAMSQTFAAGWK